MQHGLGGLQAPEDIDRFQALGVLPSVQPTHCTSDMLRNRAARARGATPSLTHTPPHVSRLARSAGLCGVAPRSGAGARRVPLADVCGAKVTAWRRLAASGGKRQLDTAARPMLAVRQQRGLADGLRLSGGARQPVLRHPRGRDAAERRQRAAGTSRMQARDRIAPRADKMRHIPRS